MTPAPSRGQVIRLVHSVPPRSPPQRGALWYGQKLRVVDGFEVRFTFQFQRPSTCAASDHAPSPAPPAHPLPPADSVPYWQRRETGCPIAGVPTGAAGFGPPPRTAWTPEGAVGGEGLALVVHSDPRGLEAAGCVGPGAGYASDFSYFTRCPAAIVNSLALQMSPHRNVTFEKRPGPEMLDAEEPTVRWSDSNAVGVYLNGSNSDVGALLQTHYGPTYEVRPLTDGEPHSVTVRVTGGQLDVFLDDENDPSIVVQGLDLSAIGVADGAGKAWIGFTAASGHASSIDTDLLEFAVCQKPGCEAA